MSYSCDDAEPCERYEHKIVRARKAHKCTACGRPIQPGHHYSRTELKFEGEVQTFKRCGACHLIYQHLVFMGNGAMHPMENLDCGLDYEVEWDGPPPDAIAALAFATDDEAGRMLAATPPEGAPARAGGETER